MVLVTKLAPDFTASAVLPNGNIINDFNLRQYIKEKLAVIFFWPMDFTFVCPSELIACNKRHNEFNKRNVKIIGVSFDSAFTHYAWRNLPINQGGIGNVNFPMVADVKREIIMSYGIEHPNLGVALRSSFVIDTKGIIRHQTINDLPLGRNFDEIIRIIDALEFYEKNGLVCPAQWEKNKAGIKPNAEGIAQFLSENFNDL